MKESIVIKLFGIAAVIFGVFGGIEAQAQDNRTCDMLNAVTLFYFGDVTSICMDQSIKAKRCESEVYGELSVTTIDIACRCAHLGLTTDPSTFCAASDKTTCITSIDSYSNSNLIIQDNIDTDTSVVTNCATSYGYNSFMAGNPCNGSSSGSSCIINSTVMLGLSNGAMMSCVNSLQPLLKCEYDGGFVDASTWSQVNSFCFNQIFSIGNTTSISINETYQCFEACEFSNETTASRADLCSSDSNPTNLADSISCGASCIANYIWNNTAMFCLPN